MAIIAWKLKNVSTAHLYSGAPIIGSMNGNWFTGHVFAILVSAIKQYGRTV